MKNQIGEKTTASKLEKLRSRQEKIKAQISQELARLKREERKERNGQLIALGIFMEMYFRIAHENAKKNLVLRIKRMLTGRNLERALAALDRLSNEKASPKKEISPEPPSQLPEAEAQEKNQGSA